MAGQAEACWTSSTGCCACVSAGGGQAPGADDAWNHPEARRTSPPHSNVPASLARLGEALRAAGYRGCDERRKRADRYRPAPARRLLPAADPGRAVSTACCETAAGDAYLRLVRGGAAGGSARGDARAGATRVDDRGPCAISTASDASCSRRCAWVICCCCRSRVRRPSGRGLPRQRGAAGPSLPGGLPRSSRGFGADALIHFGTHGTQEWLPGKDRGLAVGDLPLRALGDLPVFYPYIRGQRWRGDPGAPARRAVTVSHQTPSFAPAGLYDELRGPAPVIRYEYQQLDEGAVRGLQRRADPRGGAGGAHERRPGLERGSDARGFPGVPRRAPRPPATDWPAQRCRWGLHTFGVAASPELRLGTVMRQLGEALLPRARSRPRRTVRRRFPGRCGKVVPTARCNATCATAARSPRWPIPRLREQLLRARELDRQLADTGELEALLAGLAERFVAPGPGGDPIRGPQVPSGLQPVRLRGRQGTDPRRLRKPAPRPSASCWLPRRAPGQGAGKARLQPLVVRKPCATWASSKARRCTPRPAPALGRRWPPAGAGHRAGGGTRGVHGWTLVLQVTSVYRDQFDGSCACSPRPSSASPRWTSRATRWRATARRWAAPARTRRRSATGAAPVAPAAVRLMRRATAAPG
ncbi:cobaltochelatase subunit CobN [Pseudomonas aeruginosa]|nr:cobaltochelatase subunit CobN [Pseudomonas aeruginosa]